MEDEKEKLLEELEITRGIAKKILTKYQQIFKKTGEFYEAQINRQLDHLNELDKLEKRIKEK